VNSFGNPIFAAHVQGSTRSRPRSWRLHHDDHGRACCTNSTFLFQTRRRRVLYAIGLGCGQTCLVGRRSPRRLRHCGPSPATAAASDCKPRRKSSQCMPRCDATRRDCGDRPNSYWFGFVGSVAIATKVSRPKSNPGQSRQGGRMERCLESTDHSGIVNRQCVGVGI
jgi:hypothetical protein